MMMYFAKLLIKNEQSTSAIMCVIITLAIGKRLESIESSKFEVWLFVKSFHIWAMVIHYKKIKTLKRLKVHIDLEKR